jgi:hypothetical protein
MAYTDERFRYQATLKNERLEPPLICGYCYPAGMHCDFHNEIDCTLPFGLSTTQRGPNFNIAEAWTNNGSEVSFDSYQSSSSSPIHDLEQSSTNAAFTFEESNSSFSEDEQLLRRSKAHLQYTTHAQQYPHPIECSTQPLQTCDELSTHGEVGPHHRQSIDPALLVSVHHDVSSDESTSKKRRRTQDDLQSMQSGKNNDGVDCSTNSMRISLLDPQTVQQARSNEQHTVLHQLKGFYAEFTLAPSPQDLQTIRALASLLDRLVRDWLHKPSRVKCLIPFNNVPTPPADRDAEKPFPCVYGCKYKAKELGELKRHMRQNWVASYWECPLCQEHFGCRDKLSDHLRKRHSGSGDTVDYRRDFRPNEYDDELTKKCGFCGEVCKGFNAFVKHIGKHFRGGLKELPKSMRDWKDDWDDDDSNNNGDGKGPHQEGKSPQNSTRHNQSGGSNRAPEDSSKGRDNDSSKEFDHSRDRNFKQDNRRPSPSGSNRSEASNFGAFDAPSNDRLTSLSDTSLPLRVRHVPETRTIGCLPLHSKGTAKEPQKPAVADSIVDAVMSPPRATPKALPQLSDPPSEGSQSSEVIRDAADRWKAFRLKYDSFEKKTNEAQARALSRSRRALATMPPPLSCPMDTSRIAGKRAIRPSKRLSVAMRASIDDLADNLQGLEDDWNANHNMRRRPLPSGGNRGRETARPGTNMAAETEPDPFEIRRPFGRDGRSYQTDSSKGSGRSREWNAKPDAIQTSRFSRHKSPARRSEALFSSWNDGSRDLPDTAVPALYQWFGKQMDHSLRSNRTKKQPRKLTGTDNMVLEADAVAGRRPPQSDITDILDSPLCFTADTLNAPYSTHLPARGGSIRLLDKADPFATRFVSRNENQTLKPSSIRSLSNADMSKNAMQTSASTTRALCENISGPDKSITKFKGLGGDAQEFLSKDMSASTRLRRIGTLETGFSVLLPSRHDREFLLEQAALAFPPVDPSCPWNQGKDYTGDLNSQNTWEPALWTNRWFTRNWTLQERLAPSRISLDAPNVPNLPAPLPRPDGHIPCLSTLAVQFAEIDLGIFARCRELVEQHSNYPDLRYTPTYFDRCYDRHATGCHPQLQKSTDMVSGIGVVLDFAGSRQGKDLSATFIKQNTLGQGGPKAQVHKDWPDDGKGEQRVFSRFAPYDDVTDW